MRDAVFAICLLLVCGTTLANHHQLARALHHERSSHHARSHFTHLKTRAEDNECKWTCDVEGPEPSNSSNWELEIVLKFNQSVQISIGYEVSVNVFGVINQELKFGLAFDGNTGLVGLFNLTSGGALIINVVTGAAILIENNADLKNLGGGQTVDLYAALIIFAKIIKENSSQIGDGCSPDHGNLLNVTILINLIYKNPSGSISEAFNGRVDLEEKFNLSFGLLVSNIREQVTKGEIDASYGVLGIIVGVFDQPNDITSGLIKVFVAIYSRTNGKFTSVFILQIYKILSVSVSGGSVQTIFVRLTYTIQLIGVLYKNLEEAITAYQSGNTVENVIQKTLVIGSVTYVITFVRTTKGDWLISIKSQSNDSLDIIIAFVRAQNLLVIYNRKLNVVVVLSGSLGLFAIWNTSTGEGIVVRVALGGAVVVDSQSSIVKSFAAGAYFEGFIAIGGQIEFHKSFSIFTAGYFNLQVFVVALKGSYDAALLTVSSRVRAVIQGSFSAYFAAVAAAKGFLGSLTVIGTIVGAAGSQVQISLAIVKSVTVIYVSNLLGKFSAVIADVFYKVFSTSYELLASGGFVEKLVAAIKVEVSGGVTLGGGTKESGSVSGDGSGKEGGSVSGSAGGKEDGKEGATGKGDGKEGATGKGDGKEGATGKGDGKEGANGKEGGSVSVGGGGAGGGTVSINGKVTGDKDKKEHEHGDKGLHKGWSINFPKFGK